MTIPVLALVGRPNVGKSTLFNRLTKTREAIVANHAGLTRDRQYGRALLFGHIFILIDTGGLTGSEEGIDEAMAQQAKIAIDESDGILFIVDASEGLTAADQNVAESLRRLEKPTWLVANKIDGKNPAITVSEFYSLGYGNPHPIAAVHGRGVNTLIRFIVNDSDFWDGDADQIAEPSDNLHGIKVGIVGRPNVGKSTLINCMLGENRVAVYDEAGTTRDSIYIPFERNDRAYTLIDTAGLRRRGKVSETIEKFSIVKTLRAIEDSHVVLLVLDAREGLVEQDMHILGIILEAGRAVVLVINKWDGLDFERRETIRKTLHRRLTFVPWIKIHCISALNGTGIGQMYHSINKAYRAATIKMSTSQLSRILEYAVKNHAPPLVRGRRIKLRYAHQGGMNPPRIIVHGNQTKDIPDAYSRYLENVYRNELKIGGSPVKIEFKSGKNPFADRRNKLTDRQIQKKRRLMQFVKKRKS